MAISNSFLSYSAAAVFSVVTTAANALTIDFDQNGSDQGGTITDVKAFDWLPGASYTVGASADIQIGDILTSYVQGSLGDFIGLDGNAIQNNFGLGEDYEITFVAGFDEMIYSRGEGLNPVTGNYETNIGFVSIDSPVNFFQIWIDNNPNVDPLAGTGYNDGTLIASGTILKGGTGTMSSTFAYSGDPNNPVSEDPSKYVKLDQFDVDDWGGTKSNVGIGGALFDTKALIENIDTNYFLVDVDIMNLLFNSSQTVPFRETNPPKSFTDENGNAILVDVGTINGINGDGVLLQVDGNNSFLSTEVPVPSTFFLMLGSLLPLGFISAFKKKKS